MNRLGQTAVAIIAASGACIGGAAAIATTTGIAPAQFLTPSPTATFHAIADAVLPNRGATGPTVNSAVLHGPAAHAVTGASGTGASTNNAGSAQSVAHRAKAPTSHARSGASGAAGALTSARGAARGGDEREED